MGMVIVRAWVPFASDGLFIATHRIDIHKFSDLEFFGRQFMPPPWAWLSFGLGPLLQAMGF